MSILQRLKAALERQGSRVLGPQRPRPGDPVTILTEHPLDFWHEASGLLLADFGEAGKLVSYRQRGEESLILAVVPRESWGKSEIDRHARPHVIVCGTVALDKPLPVRHAGAKGGEAWQRRA